MSEAPRPKFSVASLARILVAQATFGFGWCLYLLQPKYLSQSLGAGPDAIGAVGAISGVAAVVAILAVVFVIDRPGGRRLLFHVGSALLVLASLGYQLVERFGALVFVLQAVIAISYVLCFNSAMALVTDVAPREHLGQAFGLQSASNLVMNAVSSTLAEAVAERWGWRWVFGVAAVAGVASSITAMRLPRTQGAESRASPPEAPPYGQALPAFVACALTGAAYVAMFTFHQPFAMELGAKRLGGFFVGFTAAALAMRLGFGGLGDRFGHRPVVLGAFVLYALVPFSMMWLSPSLLWAYGAALGLAHGVSYPTLTAFATEYAPPSTRGRIIAVYSGSFNAGSSVAALAWGRTAVRFGYPPVFGLAGAAMLTAFVFFGVTTRGRAREL
jgi:predicted MFS family arabinose efflux permease